RQQPLAVADAWLGTLVPPVDREERAQPARNQRRPRDRLGAPGNTYGSEIRHTTTPQPQPSRTLAADSRSSKAGERLDQAAWVSEWDSPPRAARHGGRYDQASRA